MTDFGDLKQMHQVQGLHDLLKPHLVHTESPQASRIRLVTHTSVSSFSRSVTAPTNEGTCRKEHCAQGGDHR
jgi:hypothetical protein